MDALESIFARRSIRKYTEKDLSDDQIQELLRAAMAAPTTVGKNDRAYVVVREQKNKDLIMQLKPGHADMLKTAPVVVIICADSDLAYKNSAGYWAQDCSAAAQNMLIAATAMGLGSCWLGIHPHDDRAESLREALELPANIVPFCGIALGYPAEQKPPHDRYDENKVYLGR